MALQLVPPTPPDAKQALVERVKALPRPDGAIQCPRCGSRSMLTVTNGAVIKGGRKQGGIVTDKDVCADCWRKGIKQQMLPDPPKLAKEPAPPKPRRTKPKAVK